MINLNNIEKVLELKAAGLASRDIAFRIGISKSSVNNIINRHSSLVKSLEPKSKEGPRILIFDLETAPTLSYTFGRWKQNISQDAVVEEGGWIICASYKWLGESEVHVLYNRVGVVFQDDLEVCSKLWDLYHQADAVVAHNALAFDHKVLQGRCMINSLPPLPSVKVLDTLQMAKKNFKLNSNKLDSIADILELGRKNQTGGIKLWIDTLAGEQEALDKMLEYCKQDTALLEQVFLKLRAYGQASNFNASHYHEDDDQRCPVCGSSEVLPTGRTVYTDVSSFVEMRCHECSAVHRQRKALNTKEKRSTMLAAAKI